MLPIRERLVRSNQDPYADLFLGGLFSEYLSVHQGYQWDLMSPNGQSLAEDHHLHHSFAIARPAKVMHCWWALSIKMLLFEVKLYISNLPPPSPSLWPHLGSLSKSLLFYLSVWHLDRRAHAVHFTDFVLFLVWYTHKFLSILLVGTFFSRNALLVNDKSWSRSVWVI